MSACALFIIGTDRRSVARGVRDRRGGTARLAGAARPAQSPKTRRQRRRTARVGVDVADDDERSVALGVEPLR